MALGPIRITAPAKINLYLAVGATRPDRYHDVTTILHALEFGDEIVMRPADSLSLASDIDLGIPTHENLAYRAAQAFAVALGRKADVAIRLTKRVPHGAGLGGGSSDAAAVLLGMAHLWDLEGHEATMYSVAAALGADVPFFLDGGGALYDGRGDRLVRSVPALALPVALIRPPVAISTAEAYRAFDGLAQPTAPGPAAVIEALERGSAEMLGAALYNNMTDAALRLAPVVADALALCQAAPGVQGAAMCGSGSAVFALCESDAAAREVTTSARERGWWGMVTRMQSARVEVQTAREVS
ncbi:MAG: 4-(cytidine 5'-diphospho)-2-C-methyl-D-erythritol kinase [Actinobacteria bacterium]|nr:4-(cytidine 5'-diphospho)-2-C-methyl-D-erythritol kinase [Actinomycetota bacterium]MCG2806679.1 4-(cytidine 5'-diphospho)-2-C-methyl-D-erythritol kinase [Coriobacteriia bacterium]